MKIIYCIAISLCLSTLGFADIKLVQKVKTSAVMGKAAKDTNLTISVKGRKARVDMGGEEGSYQIIDLEEGKAYIVMPAQKRCMTLSTEQMKQTAGMMSQMAGSQSKPQVEKLGTKHTYNGYSCQDVKISTTGQMMSMTSVSCISSEIDAKEFKPFMEFGQDFSKAFGMDVMEELQGFPVHSQTQMTMMGQKIDSSSDLVSFTHDSLPESIFAVPADLTCQPMKMPDVKPH